MHRPFAVTALGLATALLATACAGGGSGGNPAASAGAGTTTGSAAGSGAGSGAQNAGSVPQITVTEEEGGNDGPDATLPQGMSADKATAAGMGSDGAPVISVTNTDTSCIPDKATVPAGKIWIKITNEGTRITEGYLEDKGGEELAEVENITAGQSGAFTTTVKEGDYLIACEPGMADVQIRTPLTVTPGG